MAKDGEVMERGSRNYPYISWSPQDSYRSDRRRFSRDSIQTEENLQIFPELCLSFKMSRFFEFNHPYHDVIANFG